MHRRLALLSSLCLLSSLALGCASTRGSAAAAGSDGDWLEPSPGLARKIEDHASRLPWAPTLEERIELIQWFASVGEPAYTTLLGLVTDPRPDVAGAALAALGSTGDSRLVSHVRALPWPPEEQSDLALERARALLMLGDWSMVPLLIDGLRDERLYTRAVCVRTLSEATRERFGYEPGADPEVREAAVLRWERWWAGRRGDRRLSPTS